MLKKIKTLFLPIIILVITIILFYLLIAQIVAKQLLTDASLKKAALISSQLSTQLEQISSPLELSVNVVSNWGKNGELKLSKDSIIKKLSPILNNLPAVTGFTIANSKGFTFFIAKTDNGWRESSTGPNYFAPNRPWFLGAIDTVNTGDVFWTEPYIFFSSKKPGITSSAAWIDERDNITWVVAFDIRMEDLLESIDKSGAVKGATVVLLDDKNRAIYEVYSNKNDSDDKISRSNRIIGEAIYQYGRDRLIQNSVIKFKYNGENYWTSIKPINHQLGKINTMIILQENIVFASIKQKIILITLLGIFSLIIVSIIAYLIFHFRVKKSNLTENIANLNMIFSSSTDMNSFLSNTVHLIADIMDSPVCSIYFFDRKKNHLVLKATEGLNRSFIDKTTLKYGEGLIGLSLKELRPINVNYASSQKNYYSVSGLNEEKYDSLLAVPIIRGLNKIGVITVQRDKSRPYNQKAAYDLETIASQLTSVLETAGSLLTILDDKILPQNNEELDFSFIRGKVAAPGYALAAARIDHQSDVLDLLKQKDWDIEYSIKDFETAIEKTAEELEKLQIQVEDCLADAASMIFTAHLLMLKDASFSGAIIKLIENGINPPIAILHVAEELILTFSMSTNRIIKEKVNDVKDLAHRLIYCLSDDLKIARSNRGRIVIARELFPSDILLMSIEKVKGIILISGGVTSHLAILCRSLNIPLIMTNENKALLINDGTSLLLDATHGIAYIEPNKERIKEYHEFMKSNIDTSVRNIKETITTDNVKIDILCNVNLVNDAISAAKYSIAGVGLYRSEFPFMIRESFPTEEEQFNIYSKAIAPMNGKEFIFRTLDVGGDKTLPYYDSPKEENPFLGLRAIRFLLKEPAIFRAQIRAILRAATTVDLKIMFPMIQSIDEFIEAKAFVIECYEQLKAENISICKMPKIGIMVELPAVLPLLENFASIVDFFSIGTNDLIQYLLATDRTNVAVSYLYKPQHPAVLKAIASIAAVAKEFNKPVSLCGDMANNEALIPFLIGCGISRLSVHHAFIYRVQTTIISLSMKSAIDYRNRLLKCDTIAETNEIISKGLL